MTDKHSVEYTRFIQETVEELKFNRDFVELVRFEELKITEYGDLLDCFKCVMNQRYHFELICTTEYLVDEVNVFAGSSESEPFYVLSIEDYGSEYGSTELKGSEALCFTSYAASKRVLRKLVDMYSADGV